jgi:hypothetical protein
VGCRSHAMAARAKGREKFRSAKIQRNLLKMLDQDERIQGNPSFPYPRNQGFSAPDGPSPRKPKLGRPGPSVAPVAAREPSRLCPNAERSNEKFNTKLQVIMCKASPPTSTSREPMAQLSRLAQEPKQLAMHDFVATADGASLEEVGFAVGAGYEPASFAD